MKRYAYGHGPRTQRDDGQSNPGDPPVFRLISDQDGTLWVVKRAFWHNAAMPRLDAIGLIVSHMGTAIDFYRKLGLEFPTGSEAEDHVEAVHRDGMRLMFDTEEWVKGHSAWEAPVGSHRVALAFLCEDPAKVDRLHHELVASGAQSYLAPFDAPWGQRYATVLDPAGNAVDLFAPLP